MATKKVTKKATTKKRKFVTVDAGEGTVYTLTPTRMVGKGWYGRFIMKGEVKLVLRELFYGQRETTPVTSYYKHNGEAMRHAAYRSNNPQGFNIDRENGQYLRAGCHAFSPADVRKLARWTGLPLK